MTQRLLLRHRRSHWFIPGTTTTSLDQDSAPVGKNAVSIPQDSDAEQSEADQQNGDAEQSEADQQNGDAQQSEADQQNGGAQQNEADQNVVVNLSTEAQQDVQSIPPAATGAPADAAAVPNNADPKAGQTPATDTTRDGNMAVPGKVGGNGTNSRGGLGGALRSAADQISSSISKLTGGLTGGTKTGETSTGDTKAGESGTGGSQAPANPAATTAGTGGRHRAE